MNNTSHSSRPLPRLNRSFSIYRQIEAILREQILSGEYAGGDRLPTEEALCALYRVSRPTVRQALDELAAENLVRREQGRGTFVIAPEGPPPPDAQSILIDEFLEPPASVKIALQRTGTLRGHGIVHDHMNQAAGTEFFYFVRLYLKGAEVIGAAKVYLPMALGEKLRKTDLTARNIYKMLAKRGDVTPSSADFSIGATLAQPLYAEMLGLRAGVPLMFVRRTSRDGDGVPFEHSQLIFRPDLCQLTCRRPFDNQ